MKCASPNCVSHDPTDHGGEKLGPATLPAARTYIWHCDNADHEVVSDVMRQRSLLLIACLTFAACNPLHRDFVASSENDVSPSESKPDATSYPLQVDPDAGGASDANAGVNHEHLDSGDPTSSDANASVAHEHLDSGEHDASDASPRSPDASAELDAGACASNPCKHGGQCKDSAGGYACDCSGTGFSGATCEEAMDECAPNPCLHGTCVALSSGYKCDCSPGFDGQNCETDINDCASNPCAHGTCTDLVADYRCTCPAGWGGKRCDEGSCSNVSCPASAPCRVPKGNAGICYPKACTDAGLCLAENADGSGSARIFSGRNSDLGDYDWGNRAKYFAYIDEVHGGHACVFPQTDERGTPLVIQLGTKATKTSGFGLSNSWPSDACQ